MERIKERIDGTRKALEAFKEALELPFNKIVRDAAIQRFEFTVEAIWKLAQLYLRKQEGFEIASPKGVIRGCFQAGLIDENETNLALEMINDRNLTVHTYNESLAIKIYNNLPNYLVVMEHLFDVIEKR